MGPRQDAGEDSDMAWDDIGLVNASMGPRQDAGEDTVSMSSWLVPRSLQWGPGRMPGKTAIHQHKENMRQHASMGPRQDAGEDIDGLLL